MRDGWKRFRVSLLRYEVVEGLMIRLDKIRGNSVTFAVKPIRVDNPPENADNVQDNMIGRSSE